MIKKICKAIALVITIILATYGFVLLLDMVNDDNDEIPTVMEEPSKSEVELPNTDVNEEPVIIDKPEVDFNFEAIVIEDREEQGFINSSEDVESLYVNETYEVATDFSNGFIATSTEHANAISNISGYAEYMCIDNSNVVVVERNSLEHSIQDLRYDVLQKTFPTYMYYEPYGFERSATVIGTGLQSKEDVFKIIPTSDATFEGSLQLLADTTITTALGNGLLVEYFSPSAGHYVIYVFIQCDRDRIIEVKAISYSEDNVKDYVIEITNGGIYLIK